MQAKGTTGADADAAAASGAVVATVPDLICCVEAESELPGAGAVVLKSWSGGVLGARLGEGGDRAARPALVFRPPSLPLPTRCLTAVTAYPLLPLAALPLQTACPLQRRSSGMGCVLRWWGCRPTRCSPPRRR